MLAAKQGLHIEIINQASLSLSLSSSPFWFPIDNSLIPFKLDRRFKHLNIHVKFEKGDNPQNLTKLWSFLTYILAKLPICDFRSITFEWMQ